MADTMLSDQGPLLLLLGMALFNVCWFHTPTDNCAHARRTKREKSRTLAEREYAKKGKRDVPPVHRFVMPGHVSFLRAEHRRLDH